MKKDLDIPFWNHELTAEERADDLLKRLTLDEKFSQMLHGSAAVERLGVKDYNWWNECLHGIARAGVASVFPQAIGLAATFDPEFVYQVATVISDEGRAKHHEADRLGDHGMYRGLTYWTPNINIFRDPRWGRGQETYGECPFLTGEIGKAFVRGIQGDHDKYFKLIATPKHFAVHSGPEETRHGFNSTTSEQDLRETYLPAFRSLVIDAGAYSVMTAYNRMNGEACSASPTLLGKILRGEWGFQGYVVSDCGAIADICFNHKLVETEAEAAAMSVKEGTDLNCGCAYEKLHEAYEKKLIDEESIDKALRRLIIARIKLGMFDPPELNPYSSIPFDVVDCQEHRRLTKIAAAKSLVLLKNENDMLPVRDIPGAVAVIGPNAHDPNVLIGNYAGTPSRAVTPLDGFRNYLEPKGCKVYYAEGCKRYEEFNGGLGPLERGFSEAVSYAERSDLVIMVLGLSAELEGEQGDASNADAAGDRVSLGFSGVQQQLLEHVYAVGKPVVLVLMSGSALSIEWANDNVPAILHSWYPGQEGGNAIAEAIFGEFSPAGRLPVTVYRSTSDLPHFEDYSMEGRTYRFFDGDPLFPFGYGLSYTKFRYDDFKVSENQLGTDQTPACSVTISNIGEMDGDEVVQFYLEYSTRNFRKPLRQLVGIRRVSLKKGESTYIEIDIPRRFLASVNEIGEHLVLPGRYTIYAGGIQPDPRSMELCGLGEVVSESFELTGKPQLLPA